MQEVSAALAPLLGLSSPPPAPVAMSRAVMPIAEPTVQAQSDDWLRDWCAEASVTAASDPLNNDGQQVGRHPNPWKVGHKIAKGRFGQRPSASRSPRVSSRLAGLVAARLAWFNTASGSCSARSALPSCWPRLPPWPLFLCFFRRRPRRTRGCKHRPSAVRSHTPIKMSLWLTPRPALHRHPLPSKRLSRSRSPSL